MENIITKRRDDFDILNQKRKDGRGDVSSLERQAVEVAKASIGNR